MWASEPHRAPRQDSSALCATSAAIAALQLQLLQHCSSSYCSIAAGHVTFFHLKALSPREPSKGAPASAGVISFDPG
jgi:hypothetical protein